MAVSFQSPIFDIRRDAFPEGDDGERMWKELQNFVQMLNQFIVEFVKNTEYVRMLDGITEPTTVSGVTFIYTDVADGDLKVKFGDGTTKTISADT